MNSHAFRLLAFLSVLAFCCESKHAAAQAPEVSLLSNGAFASDAKNPGWPDDWPRTEGATWEQEDGVHFLRLKSTTPGQTILLFRQLVLPSPAPAALDVRLRVRFSDIKPGEKAWFDGRVMGNFKDANGKTLKPNFPPPTFRGTSKGWVDHQFFVKIPGGARTLELMPCIFQAASGTLDFARLEVFTASADQLPKPPPIVPSETIAVPNNAGLPPELHVAGNQLATAAGKPVWLQGLCLDSMEWTAGGEHIQESIAAAVDQWHANVIRLPVREHFWFGRGPWQKKDGGMGYRKLVDAAIDAAAARGAYVALDLHCFGAPMPEHLEFWKDAAVRYRNHPAVLFELFNEAHGISWKVWRDGGSVKDPANRKADANAAENSEENSGDISTGMQSLVDAIRATGARNGIIAGGLDWGYDLSGIVEGYALIDRTGGDGIIYSSHIYPWKRDWQGKFLAAATKYPIFIGEVGTPPDWKGFQFIPESQRFEDLSKGEWPPDMLGLIQARKLNWTGFSFHPKCGPMVIQDWSYTPTPYWGVFVKDALAGKTFEMKRMR